MELDHLTVTGDVHFGRNVSLRGTVIIIANHGERIDIPTNSLLVGYMLLRKVIIEIILLRKVIVLLLLRKVIMTLPTFLCPPKLVITNFQENKIVSGNLRILDH